MTAARSTSPIWGAWRRLRRFGAVGVTCSHPRLLAAGGRCCARRGLTLLEVVLSVLIVGVLLVAAMKCVGAAVSGQFSNAQRGRAHLLARGLAAEILELGYAEIDEASVLALESAEDALVLVDYVDPDDLASAVDNDQGVKRISVTMSAGGEAASLVLVVTDFVIHPQ